MLGRRDPALGIEWPTREPVLSERDATAADLAADFGVGEPA